MSIAFTIWKKNAWAIGKATKVPSWANHLRSRRWSLFYSDIYMATISLLSKIVFEVQCGGMWCFTFLLRTLPDVFTLNRRLFNWHHLLRYTTICRYLSLSTSVYVTHIHTVSDCIGNRIPSNRTKVFLPIRLFYGRELIAATISSIFGRSDCFMNDRTAWMVFRNTV